MSQLFPVQNSTLSANALAELVHREYPLQGSPVCKLWRRGMADTYRIEAGKQLFFLRHDVRQLRGALGMDIDAVFHNEIVRALSKALRAHYVFPDVAEKICACLERHLANGDYADIAEGELLALALTIHLQEVNQDEHLWVRWHPEALPDGDTSLRHNDEWQNAQRLAAQIDNYGIHKAERLPGNIGYLDLRYFHRPAWGGETAVAAMTLVTGTNALIIDLRKCTGGYPAMIALIMSYLFGEEPIHLSSIYWRDDDTTQQYWTYPFVTGKRYVDKPVYVLISHGTFSAGEEFASILQTRNRACVLGEKTAGGAHPGTSYRLADHFEAFIPIGRAIDPLTQTDLEGVGVTPNVLLPQEHAFTAAYFMALRAILERSGGASGEACQKLAREAQTALNALVEHHKLCTSCGYPNPLYRSRCKNCDELLGTDTVVRSSQLDLS